MWNRVTGKGAKPCLACPCGGIDDHVLSMRRNTTAKSPGESSAGQSSRRSSGEEELLAGQQEQHDIHVKGHLGRRNAGTFLELSPEIQCAMCFTFMVSAANEDTNSEKNSLLKTWLDRMDYLDGSAGKSIARSITSSASGARTHLQLVLAGMPSRMCWHSRTHVCASQDPPTRTSRTGTTRLSRSESRP